MKDDTIHTQDTQTRIQTNAFLTLSHRAVATFLIHCIRTHPAVIAVGRPAIDISAADAWQGIQLEQLSTCTVLVTLAAGSDVAQERALLATHLQHALERWLAQPVTIDVYVTALAPGV
jgi:hypothetical protein